MKALLLTLLVISSSAYAEQLADPYISKNACPGEGCSFGRWIVEKEMSVHSKPSKESKIISTLKPGQTIQTITGDEYISPGVGMIDHIPNDPEGLASLRKDKPVYILGNIGEGYTEIYQDGKKYSAYLGNVVYINNGTMCDSKPDPDWCWLNISKQPASLWWVQIKLKSSIGWILVEGGDVSQPDSGLE